MIIVIDGPSGSGKSSTAKAVADKLGIEYLDSGALYRAVSLIWLEEQKPSEEKFIDILSSKEICFSYRSGTFSVQVNGKNFTDMIRKPFVTEQVSHVAAIPSVRDFVNELMRRAVRNGRYIADGRDLGTVVFPNAVLKLFMEAPLAVRAKRRHDELKAAGENITLEEVENNLQSRDLSDSTRKKDPLARADDAIIIDNSSKSFDEQVEEISSLVEKVLGNEHNFTP